MLLLILFPSFRFFCPSLAPPPPARSVEVVCKASIARQGLWAGRAVVPAAALGAYVRSVAFRADRVCRAAHEGQVRLCGLRAACAARALCWWLGWLLHCSW